MSGRADAPPGAVSDHGDLLVAARTVRRALASAHAHAVDVVLLVVAIEPQLPESESRAFARRALGPHGGSVAVGAMPSASGIDGQERSEMLARAATSHLGALGAGSGLVVVVEVAADGSVVAICVRA